MKDTIKTWMLQRRSDEKFLKRLGSFGIDTHIFTASPLEALHFTEPCDVGRRSIDKNPQDFRWVELTITWEIHES